MSLHQMNDPAWVSAPILSSAEAVALRSEPSSHSFAAALMGTERDLQTAMVFGAALLSFAILGLLIVVRLRASRSAGKVKFTRVVSTNDGDADSFVNGGEDEMMQHEGHGGTRYCQRHCRGDRHLSESPEDVLGMDWD